MKQNQFPNHLSFFFWKFSSEICIEQWKFSKRSSNVSFLLLTVADVRKTKTYPCTFHHFQDVHNPFPTDIPRIQIWRRVSATGPGLKASWSCSGEVIPRNLHWKWTIWLLLAVYPIGLEFIARNFGRNYYFFSSHFLTSPDLSPQSISILIDTFSIKKYSTPTYNDDNIQNKSSQDEKQRRVEGRRWL